MVCSLTTFIFAKGDVVESAHRLSTPMATDRFDETFAAQVSAQNVIACVTAFRSDGVLCYANGVADGLHPGRLLFQRTISRDLTEEVRSFVNPAVRSMDRDRTKGTGTSSTAVRDVWITRMYQFASGPAHSHSTSLPNSPHLPVQLSLSPLPCLRRITFSSGESSTPDDQDTVGAGFCPGRSKNSLTGQRNSVRTSSPVSSWSVATSRCGLPGR